MSAVAIAQGEFIDCPDCEGRGERYINVRRGEHAMEADTIACGLCEGTGKVDADLVRRCVDCQVAYHVEFGGCAHLDRCEPCGGECIECRRESAAEAAAERFHDRQREAAL